MSMDETEQRAYLVITGAGLFGAYLDADKADRMARAAEGVLVEAPVIADYRPRTSDGTQAAEMGA